MRRGIVVLSLTAAGVIIGLTIGAGASTSAHQVRAAAPAAEQVHAAGAPSQDVLPALLVEVRGLRAAMEQMAAAGPRVQLALGRVQLQEQRINTLIRRLEEIRASVVAAQSDYDRRRDDSRDIEESLRNLQPGGPSLEELKAHQTAVSRELAGAASRLQRLTADEASTASEVAVEQARWTDLNQRMEALESALGGR
jgi:chromosome segregation ATPase